MGTQHKISAIIPCFNEAKLVGDVIRTLLDTPQVNEAIAVNDGSTDKSLEILRSFGKKITLINFRKNQGKAAAVAAGIRKAKGELILLVDADLIGFKPDHVVKMVDCFKKKTPCVVLGNLFSKKNSSRQFFYYRLLDQVSKNLIKYDFFTGERLYFKKDLLPFISRMKNLGYGLEAFLNHELKDKKTEVVRLTGAFQPPKEQKNGFSYQTFRSYFKEAVEISKELAREQGIKGKEALEFRRKFIHQFLQKYVSPGKKWQKIFKKYLD